MDNKHKVFLGLVLILVTLFLTGCLESSFNLATESRLPRWFIAPKGSVRSDFVVTLDSYSDFNEGYDVFKLYEKNSFFALEKIKATNRRGPIILPKDVDGYPLYVIVTVNGITDITEHRKMEPVFYMVDDPAVWKELGVEMPEDLKNLNSSK